MFLRGSGRGDVEVVLGPDGGELLLHEDQVPDLQEPVLVHDRAAVRPVLRAAVDVDLAARPARSGNAHVPVVVQQPAALDPLRLQAGDVLPQRGRLVVGVQHGDPDLVRVEAVAAAVDRAGDQVPGELDRLGLEVVAEGEVAVHLEEGAVPGGLADLLDVQGADALLHAGRPVEGRRLDAGEVRLERHHAGVDEQQGGVVVEQRCGGHHLVAAGGEEVQEAAPDLGGFHDRWSLRGVRMAAGYSGRPSSVRISASRSAMAARTRSVKSRADAPRPDAWSDHPLPDRLRRRPAQRFPDLDEDEDGHPGAQGEPEEASDHSAPRRLRRRDPSPRSALRMP